MSLRDRLEERIGQRIAGDQTEKAMATVVTTVVDEMQLELEQQRFAFVKVINSEIKSGAEAGYSETEIEALRQMRAKHLTAGAVK